MSGMRRIRSGAYLGVDFVQLGLSVHHLDVLSWGVPPILFAMGRATKVIVKPCLPQSRLVTTCKLT
jgi:hypothetical protein